MKVGVSVAQSAKDYAKEQLGSLDLSHLDKEKEVAQNVYNTSTSSLQNNFNNLLSQIESNKTDTSKNFSTGRSTIAEDSYAANQASQADLASRGVGKSGLVQLGEVGNRIETGRQYSNLANEFYDTMDELATTQKQGQAQYDLDKQNIQNVYDQTVAGVDSSAADATNQYNMTLGQLAENVQGRWDSNANAQAALKQAEAAASQAHADAVNAAKQNLTQFNKSQLEGIVSSGASVDNMTSQIMQSFGVNSAMAQRVLRELGILNDVAGPRLPNGNFYSNSSDFLNKFYSGGY